MGKKTGKKISVNDLPRVVIITAIKDESVAVIGHLASTEIVEDSERGMVYECGDFTSSGQSWRVAVAEIGSGNTVAAIRVNHAVEFLQPDVILFVGVAGSLKADVKLGHVVASTKVYCYHSGKAAAEFQPRPEIGYANPKLEQWARAVARHDDWTKRIKSPGPLTAGSPPQACVKPVAAGEQVVADSTSETYRLVRQHYSDAVAVEMEGYGVLLAAHFSGIPAIVIRGISDQLDDKEKTDAAGWQPVAAAHASAFAFELLSRYTFGLPTPSGAFSKRPFPGSATTPRKTRGRSAVRGRRSRLSGSDLVRILRAASSPLLDWPSTLDGQIWLARGELEQIVGTVQTQKRSFTVLLGEPGTGKSALLARLGHRLFELGCAVLGVKADSLPAEINSAADLRAYLNLPGGLLDLVHQVSRKRSTIVLLDQLDALADLVDLKSARLNVLLDLVRDLAQMDNLHIICSCRTFEYHHDVRLSNLTADTVTLQSPPWNEVVSALSRAGIDAKKWPETQREMLLVPQHLKVFLSLSEASHGEIEVFDTYHKMLDRLWEREVLDKTRHPCAPTIISKIVSEMTRDEVLWLPLARFDQDRAIIDHLVAVGILALANQDRSIGFRHQTIFNYAAARAFVGERLSLARYVLERQNGIFVRPRLWNTLVYMRSADSVTYRKELLDLWNTPSLRTHLRYLLIEFLGQISNPDEPETQLLLGCLNPNAYRERTLIAIAGNPAWFGTVSTSLLPALMKEPPSSVRNTPVVLSRALLFARGTVLKLLEDIWLPDASRDLTVLQVLLDLTTWDERSVGMVCEIMSRTEVNSFYVMQLATAVSADKPELAPRIIAASFRRQIRIIESEPPRSAQPESAGSEGADSLVKQVVEQMRRSTEDPYRQLIEDTTGWYDLPAVAQAAPEEFLRHVWPLFVQALSHMLYEFNKPFREYRHDHCYATRLRHEPGLRIREFPVVAAMEESVVLLAKNSRPGFLAFVQLWDNEDILFVQRLFARGFLELVSVNSQECLNFLLRDPRRMTLGSLENRNEETNTLIKALAPHLTAEQLRILESAILSWRSYSEIPSDWSPEEKRHQLERDKRHRLGLLSAFPYEKLSPEAKAMVDQARRASPKQPAAAHISEGMHEIKAPMSVDQMAKASVANIANLFKELPDSTEWEHPSYKHRFEKWVGGSIQASRELANLAKHDPDKAMKVIRKLPPDTHGRPVGYVINALADTKIPSSEFFTLVTETEARGFKSWDYRNSVADALAKRAKPPSRLPQRLCDILEGWLTEPWDTEQEYQEDPEPKKDDLPHSVLWKHGGMVVVPQGTYAVLDALFHAYLSREPMDVTKWLSVLEGQLERSTNVRIWRAVVAWQLRFLRNAGKERGTRFLLSLLEKCPKAFSFDGGALLLANLHFWLPEDVFWRFLDCLRSSSWMRSTQALGELATVRYLYEPSDKRAQQMVDDYVSKLELVPRENEDFGLGLAYAAVNLWNDHGVRSRSTDLLLALIPVANRREAHAIMDLFRLTDPLGADVDTLRLLNSISLHSQVLALAGDSFVIDRIQDLLPANSEVVYNICKAFVESLKDQLTNISSGIALAAQDLINISLTLQRSYETKQREHGLELFERLLELNVYGARDTLDEIDGRPRNVHVRPPRRRRRAIPTASSV